MFAEIQPPRVRIAEIVGVTRDGAEVPVPAGPCFAPFDDTRLARALEAIGAAPDAPRRFAEALRWCLGRYDERRRAGAHAGPPLAALRVYETIWTIESRAANRDRPDARRLRFEYVREAD
jgi:hypothetical protein